MSTERNERLEGAKGRRTGCSRTSRRSCTARPSASSSCSPRSRAGGHVLFEDVPGTAKTVLARAIAARSGARRRRAIQCTPDLQPTDVTGLSVYNQQTREFEFRAGPGVRQHPARRRDQPRDAEDAVGAARGDGGEPGDGRRRHARAARPVPRARDREPDRAGGHVPAARGAARPLLPKTALGYPSVDEEIGSSASSAPATRSTTCSRSSTLEDVASSSARSRTSTPTSCCCAGSSSSSRATRDARRGGARRLRPREPRARATARAWALLDGRDYVDARGRRAALPAR